MKKLFIIVFFLQLISCNQVKEFLEPKVQVTIEIQPFSDMSKVTVDSVFSQLKKIYPNIYLLKPIAIPKNAFYSPRNRYRADSIINYLKERSPKNHITIGLTTKDISHTRGNIPDFGIMGLGFMPGNSCVVSSFRLSKKDKESQFFKVCIHELGHTTGLPHCEVKTCFMRDAKGGNPINEETGFCKKCKDHLISKGWNFESELE
jgi:archaemetzincin